MLILGVASVGVTTCVYLGDLWRRQEKTSSLPHWLYAGALAYWLVVFVIGALHYNLCVGIKPWLITSAWTLGVVYLLVLRRFPIGALGSFIAALSTILTSFALFGHPVERPMLGDSWHQSVLWIHIAMAFLGLTAFAFASSVSILYLIEARMLKLKRHNTLRRRLPPLDTLDRLAFRSILAGFPLYTIALLLGSMRAFGQDAHVLKPAYVFAFVSWVIYGGVLQARLMAGWRGRRAAVLTLFGFVAAFIVVVSYSFGGG
ncbi:MAG: cytochrome c biogenesis protein CcsA [Myxococcota bacterium]|nr:cytochrome c biogenesis protein CcsA [Myxococcota bacterium]